MITAAQISPESTIRFVNAGSRDSTWMQILDLCSRAGTPFRGVNLYLRGLIPMLGFPSGKVFYDCKARELGESKYPLSKMLKLAWNGIVNFSDVPLKMLTAVGLLGGAACACALLSALVQWLRGATVPGWATIVFAVAAVGSVQMISLGVLGSYIAKIFLETKRRPPFIIQEIIGSRDEARSREPQKNRPDRAPDASDFFEKTQ